MKLNTIVKTKYKEIKNVKNKVKINYCKCDKKEF